MLYLTVIDVIHWINIRNRTVIQVGESVVADVEFITQYLVQRPTANTACVNDLSNDAQDENEWDS